jgi:FtsP/CotA-like multicopper oxidase with cupredoxin domain
MSKRRKKSKSKNSKNHEITRRDMLKLGSAAGAATVFAPFVITSRKASAQLTDDEQQGDDGSGGVDRDLGRVTEPLLCGAVPDSPATTPFRDILPIPPTLSQSLLLPAPRETANTGAGEARRDPHQRWNQFLPKTFYHLIARAGTHRYHADLAPSYGWFFNGRYPAPTIRNRYGEPSIVRFRNLEPRTTTSFGRNELTVHLHNGHTASASDGFAQDFFPVGFWKDNHYANAYAGIDAFGGIGDPLEAMRTFWFHDHRAEWTANNNYLGLNGMLYLYDFRDPGHENAASGSLRLPGIYGKTDIPLILTDKRFCALDANGRNEPFMLPVIGGVNPGTEGGDKWIVNGKIQPRYRVARRKYRFRILNTGPTKTWDLSLINPSDGTVFPITVIATDGNFLNKPQRWTTPLRISVAERYDVIIDFKQFPAGTRVYLKENAPQNVGKPSPTPLPPGLAIENVLMRFDVAESVLGVPPDTPPLPATLINYPKDTPSVHTQPFIFTLNAPEDFQINNIDFNPDVPVHTVMRGTTEIWDLRNDTIAGNWIHPVHIHFEEFRVLKKQLRLNPSNDPNVVPVYQDIPLTELEKGRKDVIRLEGQQRIMVKMQFRDFIGRYLIHCHNMGHEDDFMMARWDIANSVAQVNRNNERIAEMRRAEGLPPLDRPVKEVKG